MRRWRLCDELFDAKQRWTLSVFRFAGDATYAPLSRLLLTLVVSKQDVDLFLTTRNRETAIEVRNESARCTTGITLLTVGADDSPRL